MNPEEESRRVKEEAAIPSNAFQQALSKADYNTFRNRVPLYTVAKKIPKKIVTPAEPDVLEVGRRKRRQKKQVTVPWTPHLPSSRTTPLPFCSWAGNPKFSLQPGKEDRKYKRSLAFWYYSIQNYCTGLI